MIAHDMRTPLNALSLNIQAAEGHGDDPELVRLALEAAGRNVRELSNIVESLLETEKRGEGKLCLREHLPSDLLGRSIDQVAPVAELKRLRITAKMAASPSPLVADGDRIVRVIINLLSNAIRFSPEEGNIVVEARDRSNDGHQVVVFLISDHGPGVAPGAIDRIFLSGVSIGKAGDCSSGLGLAVCKEIIEAHGGRIWVETGHSTGATFAFSIPKNLSISP